MTSNPHAPRIWIGAAAVILAAIAGTFAYFYINYYGYTRALLYQLRYGTLAETRNLNFCVGYWTGVMGKLTLNPETHVFGFADSPGFGDFTRGQLAYHRRDFPEAISLIERDIAAKGETEEKLFWLAMSYMRQAETENCLAALMGPREAGGMVLDDHPATDSRAWCSLPLTHFHDKIQRTETAARLFQQLLDRYDGTNRLYQWLLNFNFMAMDRFPQGVPPKYLIKTAFIDTFDGLGKRKAEADYPYLSFEERARDFGIDTFNSGRGVAVEDYDQDGYLDIVTGGNFEGLRYYKNEGGRTFVDRTEAAGLAGVTHPFFMTAADYDNDGWVDLLICRMFGDLVLFHNNHDGTFTDVTRTSGLLDSRTSSDMTAFSWVASWADVDNDGDLDLFVAQMGQRIPFSRGVLASPRMASKLFINDHGHFRDATREYGLADIVADEYFIGAAFGDYDLDGYPDLFLSSPFKKTSVLLRNVGGQRFERTDLIERAEGGFVTAFVDVNHDGRPDIFWGAFGDARSSTEQAVFGEHVNEYKSGHNTVLMNRGPNRMEEIKGFFDMPMGTMGASYGDLDNDGCYDFYLGTGTPEGWYVLPNLMYMGERVGRTCSERARNVSMLQGFGTVQKGHGIVFFDFNNDGKQDMYSSLGGMWPADTWPNQFFVNTSKVDNSWVKIRLRGRKTNYYGVGAKIKVTAEAPDHEDIVRYYVMDGKTGFGSAPYLAHIGLLDAVRIKGVDVTWPVSRCRHSYAAAIRQLNVLDEAACF